MLRMWVGWIGKCDFCGSVAGNEGILGAQSVDAEGGPGKVSVCDDCAEKMHMALSMRAECGCSVPSFCGYCAKCDLHCDCADPGDGGEEEG